MSRKGSWLILSVIRSRRIEKHDGLQREQEKKEKMEEYERILKYKREEEERLERRKRD